MLRSSFIDKDAIKQSVRVALQLIDPATVPIYIEIIESLYIMWKLQAAFDVRTKA